MPDIHVDTKMARQLGVRATSTGHGALRITPSATVPIAFALAFAESLVFISLLVPTWAALIGIGALIGAGDLKLWPTWIGAGFILAGPQSGGSHCRGVAA